MRCTINIRNTTYMRERLDEPFLIVGYARNKKKLDFSGFYFVVQNQWGSSKHKLLCATILHYVGFQLGRICTDLTCTMAEHSGLNIL